MLKTLNKTFETKFHFVYCCCDLGPSKVVEPAFSRRLTLFKVHNEKYVDKARLALAVKGRGETQFHAYY